MKNNTNTNNTVTKMSVEETKIRLRQILNKKKRTFVNTDDMIVEVE